MNWYLGFLTLAFLCAMTSLVSIILLICYPNTFPRINEHIQSEALLALQNSSTITTLKSHTHSNLWTTTAITPAMVSFHINNGSSSSITLTLAQTQFVHKKWFQADGTYIQVYFMVILVLRDAPISGVTEVLLNLVLPEPALAENLTPLLGTCSISGVTISDQHIYTTLPNTKFCQNVACQFDISPTVTLNSTPIELKGHLLYRL